MHSPPSFLSVLGDTLRLPSYRRLWLVGPERLGLMVAADGLGALAAAVAVAARHRVARHVQIFTGGSMLAALPLWA